MPIIFLSNLFLPLSFAGSAKIEIHVKTAPQDVINRVIADDEVRNHNKNTGCVY